MVLRLICLLVFSLANVASLCAAPTWEKVEGTSVVIDTSSIQRDGNVVKYLQRITYATPQKCWGPGMKSFTCSSQEYWIELNCETFENRLLETRYYDDAGNLLLERAWPPASRKLYDERTQDRLNTFFCGPKYTRKKQLGLVADVAIMMLAPAPLVFLVGFVRWGLVIRRRQREAVKLTYKYWVKAIAIPSVILGLLPILLTFVVLMVPVIQIPFPKILGMMILILVSPYFWPVANVFTQFFEVSPLIYPISISGYVITALIYTLSILFFSLLAGRLFAWLADRYARLRASQ